MQLAKPPVGACFDRYRIRGMASVAVTIEPTGKVSNAKTLGDFAGTPTGTCVEDAIREAAVFPPFSGTAQSIVYPFILR
jgi:hypothetical protein